MCNSIFQCQEVADDGAEDESDLEEEHDDEEEEEEENAAGPSGGVLVKIKNILSAKMPASDALTKIKKLLK